MSYTEQEQIKIIKQAYKLFFNNIKKINLKQKLQIIPSNNNRNKEYNLRLKINSDFLSSDELYKIAQYIHYCETRKYYKIHLFIDLSEIEGFQDKITYLILDMMIFYFVNVCCTSDLILSYDIEKLDFNSCALCTTAFQTYHRKFGAVPIKKTPFNQIYLQKKYTEVKDRSLIFYRWLYTQLDYTPDLTSKISTDISFTLSMYFDAKILSNMCKTIEEVIDNATFHNNEVLLLDLHYSEDLVSDFDDKQYRGVYIAILNIGKSNLYTCLSDKIKNSTYPENDIVYKKVYQAFKNHKTFMTDVYNENLFFMVTTFQKDVTSRYDNSGNSGKGLTTLIKNITGKIASHNCYVLSGWDAIFFDNRFLMVNEQGFIGFNKTNDYLNEPPDNSIFKKSALYCPGTIYNLCFISEK